MFLGITIRAEPGQGADGFWTSDTLKIETYGKGKIIYAKKSNNRTDLLLQSHELETIKGYIRRLPHELYDLLNDDFGIHPPITE